MEQELIQLIAKNILLVKSANQLGELNRLLRDHRMKIDGIPLGDVVGSDGSQVLDKNLIHDVSTLKVLQAQGVYTLSQLLDMGLEKFSSLPNIGKKKVVRLKCDLHNHGINDFGYVTLKECIDAELNNRDLVRYNILNEEDLAAIVAYCRWAIERGGWYYFPSTIEYMPLEYYREISFRLEDAALRRDEPGKSMFKSIVPVLTKLYDPEVLSTTDRWWEE